MALPMCKVSNPLFRIIQHSAAIPTSKCVLQVGYTCEHLGIEGRSNRMRLCPLHKLELTFKGAFQTFLRCAAFV